MSHIFPVTETNESAESFRTAVAAFVTAVAVCACVIFLAVCAGFFTGCDRAQPHVDYNVVLITIDTLRADHLGCYGYERETSPVIDELAKDAYLFEDAVIVTPFTCPSHASILTGNYPATHGAMTNGYALPESNMTLAESLKRHGYKTGAFVAAKWVLGERFGFDQGFDTFKEGTAKQRKGGNVSLEFVEWVKALDRESPFFGWIHYYDVHCDYFAPEPFRFMFNPDYKGSLDMEGKVGKAHFNKMELSREDVEHIIACYDGEIRYVDNCIGRILEKLQEMGVAEKTILIITSDHGESLAEEKLIGHNLCLYDYEIRVPLIIHHPGEVSSTGEVPASDDTPASGDMAASGGKRIDHQVELISLFSTVHDMLGLPMTDRVEGKSVWPVMQGRTLEPQPAFSHTAHEGDPERKYSIRTQDWKFILNPQDRLELYSRRDDPGESTNLAESHAEVRDELRKRLENFRRFEIQALDDKHQAVGFDVIEKLKELGY